MTKHLSFKYLLLFILLSCNSVRKQHENNVSKVNNCIEVIKQFTPKKNNLQVKDLRISNNTLLLTIVGDNLHSNDTFNLVTDEVLLKSYPPKKKCYITYSESKTGNPISFKTLSFCLDSIDLFNQQSIILLIKDQSINYIKK